MELMMALLLPFIGTSLGALMCFFVKNNINLKLEKCLLGFAAGVMIAAAIWSLIIPAIDYSSRLNKLSFMPVSIGIIIGVLFLLFLDTFLPHLHACSNRPEGKNSKLKKNTMLFLAVTLHNIPEGISVGVAIAGALYGNGIMTLSGAFALSLGIAIQNFPEGAIVSMPLICDGNSKKKSFLYGIFSGIVEPIFAFITVLLSSFMIPVLPYVLGFAAGAMIYVVIDELVPQSQEGIHSNFATLFFVLGFLVMMILDITLG